MIRARLPFVFLLYVQEHFIFGIYFAGLYTKSLQRISHGNCS